MNEDRWSGASLPRPARATLAAFALVIGLPLAACSNEAQLTIRAAGGDHVFTVEVVDTPETRAKGLMYVQELADDAGMLFDFKEERPVSFWMRNTYIPLDMLFIEADGTILNIHVNARPHDTTSIPSAGPVQFVLEIPGGRSVELGIEAGDQVEHARITAAQ
ncbi:DUF192 domain-containing protein [Devosia sp. XJ19-1]|uniref:DUF192 domain-containing protein n=1 Tax=Devosia ureilytica TaxID=2952754 RepID=A0A9Q4AKH7_9HYPH|nr:DUF192 domain-containing protein [Devosia ureilytica]MCP8882449.1 DUF192 domain-containing protein [Devosia ureilytica]MCP8885664.1 DUF192 domain-containing protein [Devosia ureilytica]